MARNCTTVNQPESAFCSFRRAHAPRELATTRRRRDLNVSKIVLARAPKRAREARALPGSEAFRGFDDVLGVDAAFLHYLGAGSAQAEFMQTDYFAVQSHILIPGIGHTGFDRHTFPA